MTDLTRSPGDSPGNVPAISPDPSPTPSLTTGSDGRPRCSWAGTDPIYLAYHDDEWGRPLRTEQALYEKVCLEGFQAGLSWITVLRKRERFREVFRGFVPERVAEMGEDDIAAALLDTGIVRNRQKVEAAIGNARATIALRDEGGLPELIWSFRDEGPRARPHSREEVPTTSAASVALSTALRARGFRFVGPTTMYALLQAAGIVDDHVEGCWRADDRARERQ